MQSDWIYILAGTALRWSGVPGWAPVPDQDKSATEDKTRLCQVISIEFKQFILSEQVNSVSSPAEYKHGCTVKDGQLIKTLFCYMLDELGRSCHD